MTNSDLRYSDTDNNLDFYLKFPGHNRKYAKAISEKELERVKEYLKGSMLLSLENTTNRMIRIANSYLYFNIK